MNLKFNNNFVGDIGLILWHDIAMFQISMCVHNHYTFVRFHFTRIKIEGGIEMFIITVMVDLFFDHCLVLHLCHRMNIYVYS